MAVSVGDNDLRVRHVEPWIVTDQLNAGTNVKLCFIPNRQLKTELIYWQRHQMVFEGDTLVEMSPQGSYSPMFAALSPDNKKDS